MNLKYLAILLFLALSLAAPGRGTAASPFVVGEILVRFIPSLEERRPGDLFPGSRGIRKIHRLPLYRVPLPEGVTVSEGLDRYRGRSDVAYAEPNYLRYGTTVLPDDLLFDRQWGLYNTGQEIRGFYGTAGADIHAVEAWGRTTGENAVIVAVMDSGIDWRHGDLSENIWRNSGEIPDNGIDDDGNGYIDDVRGWDFLDEDNDPMDGNGHGSHLAGIIGARGNNGLGVAGVNWRVSLMALRFLDASGVGSVADEIEAMAYAMENGAAVINASIGGTDVSLAERDAIALLMERGILFVAAAGNDGTDNDAVPSYPSGYDLPNILSVTATDENDYRCYFSNYGALSVDGGTPGLSILSTLPGDAFGYLSGTSMATAFASGLAGLLLSAFPLSTGPDILYRILYGTDPLPSLAGLTATGGRFNAAKAMDVSPPSTPPGAPSELLLLPLSGGGMELTWQDGSSDESGFEIERQGEGERSFTRIVWTPLNAVSFTDGPLMEAAEYAYRLRAFNPRGASSYSNEGRTVTLLEAPSNLQATGLSSTAIRLDWQDASTRERGFRVERKNGESGVFQIIAEVREDSETYEDSGLSAGTAYSYRIRAFDDRTVSPYTAEVRGTTLTGGGDGGGGGCFLSILSGS